MKKNGTIEQIRRYPSPSSHVRIDEVLYWSDGLRVKGLLAKPKMHCNGQALLYLRGGLQSIGMVRPARIAQFAQQGFTVFAPYYRGNRGGEGRDEFVGADCHDAIYAVDVLKQLSKVEKVHLFGFSRGGVMALWTAIKRSDIAAVVTWAGVSDITAIYWERQDMRRALKRIIGGTPNKVAERYEERSPFMQINDVQSPILIIHGTEDQHVPISHAVKLETALRKHSKAVETWYAKGLGHHYPPAYNYEIVEKLCQWMQQSST